MITQSLPAGAWIATRLEIAGKSPVGRLARRYRERLLISCFTMPSAAFLAAKIGALGSIPAGASDAFAPSMAATIAGALTVSPRLHLEALFLARIVTSAATTMLVAIGGITVAAVLFWDEPDPALSWTLGEAVAYLRAAAPTIFANLFFLWLLLCVMRFMFVGFRSGPLRRPVLFDRKMAARHEAAHALVASVLGMPLEGAWVLHDVDTRGIGGAVTLRVPPMPLTTRALYGLLARKVAVNVAGVVGARGKRPMDAILHELRFQNDWVQATELSWIGASLHPDRVLVRDVLEALVPALQTMPWKRAIATAATALLRAGSDPVPPDVFATIVRRFGLALPAVEAIAEAAMPSGRPMQEIAA